MEKIKIIKVENGQYNNKKKKKSSKREIYNQLLSSPERIKEILRKKSKKNNLYQNIQQNNQKKNNTENNTFRNTNNQNIRANHKKNTKNEETKKKNELKKNELKKNDLKKNELKKYVFRTKEKKTKHVKKLKSQHKTKKYCKNTINKIFKEIMNTNKIEQTKLKQQKIIELLKVLKKILKSNNPVYKELFVKKLNRQNTIQLLTMSNLSILNTNAPLQMLKYILFSHLFTHIKIVKYQK